MRCFLIFAALSALLSACASSGSLPEPPATPETGCAQSSADGEKDGGLGGTGNAPDPCDGGRAIE